MNHTIFGLLSALAIYGLATLALPRAGFKADDDPSLHLEDSSSVENQREGDDDSAQNG
jgi:hypothetical protein